MHIRLITQIYLFCVLTAATILFLAPLSVFAFQNSLICASEQTRNFS